LDQVTQQNAALVEQSTCSGSAENRSTVRAARSYSVTFFIFWGVIAISGAITALFDEPVRDRGAP
jgi:hypothetical protein